MKTVKILLPLLALGLGAASAQTIRTIAAPSVNNLELGLTGGYYRSGGAQFFVGMRNLYGPIGARLSASYASGNGGFSDSTTIPVVGSIKSQKAAGLINNTKAKSTMVGLDATYELGEIATRTDLTVYGGLRYGHFTSTINYADKSYADYTSNRFGLGAGVEAGYAVTNNLSVIGNLGADYYFKGDIKSKDSNGNSDTLSSDSLNFVSQPGGVFKAGVGVKYRF